MPKPFIICGNDPILLATRKLVLEHAGLRSQAVLGIASLPQHPEGTLVLCHTLSEVERASVVHSVRCERSEAPILVIGDDDLYQNDESLLQVSAFAGTESFIAAAKQLAQYASGAAASDPCS